MTFSHNNECYKIGGLPKFQTISMSKINNLNNFEIFISNEFLELIQQFLDEISKVLNKMLKNSNAT